MLQESRSLILAPFSGVLIGQAVTIHEWEFRDGTRGGPIAEANAVDDRQKKSTSAEDVAQAGQSVLPLYACTSVVVYWNGIKSWSALWAKIHAALHYIYQAVQHLFMQWQSRICWPLPGEYHL